MRGLVRLLVAAAVLAYAVWLAWPFASPLIEGGGRETIIVRLVGTALDGGQLFGVAPAWGVWAAAVFLYAVSALMLAAGNPNAGSAYFLGLLADAALRLALDVRDGGAAAAGPPTITAAPAAVPGLPVEPLWLLLGALAGLGLLVMAAARRVRRVRVPGQFAW